MKRARRQQGRKGPVAPPAQQGRRGFDPTVLDKTVIAIPLLRDIEQAAPGTVFKVMIDLNLEYEGGPRKAREDVEREIVAIVKAQRKDPRRQRVDGNSGANPQYAFASIDGEVLRELVRRDTRRSQARGSIAKRAIFHVWPDFEVRAL